MSMARRLKRSAGNATGVESLADLKAADLVDAMGRLHRHHSRLQEHGCAGVLTDGRLRDFDELAEYAHPGPDGFADADLSPEAARWDPDLGEFVLDWEDVRAKEEPSSLALEFAHSAYGHACSVCGWDPALAGSGVGRPPPIS
jgi:hypothetical protein